MNSDSPNFANLLTDSAQFQHLGSLCWGPGDPDFLIYRLVTMEAPLAGLPQESMVEFFKLPELPEWLYFTLGSLAPHVCFISLKT